jgi:hypothetical protein
MPTPPYKVLATNDGLLRHSVPGETLIYKVTGDDTNGTLDVLVLNNFCEVWMGIARSAAVARLAA